MLSAKNAASAAVGVATAIAGDVTLRTRLPRQRVALTATQLAMAALVYPLARSRREANAAMIRESLALAAFGTLALQAGRGNGAWAGRLLAAGWVGHAVFDSVHDGGEQSQIPDWYPAFCAGYDLAIAARLLS